MLGGGTKTRFLSLPPLLMSFFPALGGVLLWCVVGVLNMEAALHIEYSLGSSSGWHSWFDRGDPGEVIRRWGVPIYDQWSGLGYRLPTQGLLTDTPLSYLAMVLPVNSVVALAWLASLWYMFALVHRWVRSWVGSRRVMWCVLVDVSLLGMMSFYTLWHGWQEYVIQIAGAVVCMVSITSREVVEKPEQAPVYSLTANLSLGTLMLMMPHLGYGMTYAPTITVLFMMAVFTRRRVLVRRIIRRPAALVPPVLALAALLPGVLDVIREQHLQAGLETYQPEYGVLHYTLDYGNLEFWSFATWAINLGRLGLTTVFPLVGLLRLETFEQGWWAHLRTPFHGGVLLLTLSGWSLVRPRQLRLAVLERTVAAIALGALLVALLNTNFEQLRWLSLDWMPVWVLSNSRWQYSDLAFLLVLVLLVWRADEIQNRLRFGLKSKNPVRSPLIEIHEGEFVIRIGLQRLQSVASVLFVFSLVCLVCVLPYRVLVSLSLNDGQTRFAPLRFDGENRSKNEQWRTEIMSLQSEFMDHQRARSQRVLIDSIIGGEGAREWFGLRSHSQLRDVQLSSVYSWSRLRSADTLSSGRKLQSQVGTPKFDPALACNSGLPDALDFLGVDWTILEFECARKFLSGSPGRYVKVTPSWFSYNGSRRHFSIPGEMRSQASRGAFVGSTTSDFHHWWTSGLKSRAQQCGFLVEDCVKKLGFRRTKALDGSPLEICTRDCVATYRISGYVPPGRSLVVPLNFDVVLRAWQDGRQLEVQEYAGLVAIPSSELKEGTVVFSVEPDAIMKLRAAAPVVILLLALGTAAAGTKRRSQSSE